MRCLKTLNWIGFIFTGLCCFFLGIIFAQLIGKANLGEAISNLIGGALGAAITVFGAIWLARYQAKSEVRAFNRLIAESITAIRDEAYYLVCLSKASIENNHESIGEKLKDQVKRIEETFNLFENNMKLGAIDTYETRLWIYRLEKIIQENLRVFKKEGLWLDGTLTKAVVSNAQSDLGFAADQIYVGCVGANRELNHKEPLPSEEDLEDRGIPLCSSE